MPEYANLGRFRPFPRNRQIELSGDRERRYAAEPMPAFNADAMDKGKGGNAGRKDALTEVARTGHRKAEVSALMPGAADKDYYCIWRMRQVRMKASRRE